MVSTSSGGSSDESRSKTKNRKRDDSPNQDRRLSKKDNDKSKGYKDVREGKDFYKSNRDFKRGNDNRDKFRDRDNRNSRYDHTGRDERQNGKRKYEKSPTRREEGHSRYREYDERYKRPRTSNDYDRRRDDNKSKRFNFNDMKAKNEPSPEWGKSEVKQETKPAPTEKEKPNFGLSGKLTEDANTVHGVVIKYAEPADARKPKRRWRLYPFKGEKALPTLYVHRQSAYLMGRDRKVADIPLDHPSCSKQHAALQYRLVSFQREGGGEGRRLRPYLIDLDSANGTFVNNVKLEPRRFHELLERDVLKFGFSSREYVLLHEQSKDDTLDDDVPMTAA